MKIARNPGIYCKICSFPALFAGSEKAANCAAGIARSLTRQENTVTVMVRIQQTVMATALPARGRSVSVF